MKRSSANDELPGSRADDPRQVLRRRCTKPVGVIVMYEVNALIRRDRIALSEGQSARPEDPSGRAVLSQKCKQTSLTAATYTTGSFTMSVSGEK